MAKHLTGIDFCQVRHHAEQISHSAHAAMSQDPRPAVAAPLPDRRLA